MSVSLKDYIKSTLTQIIDANVEFNEEQKAKGTNANTDTRLAADSASTVNAGFINGMRGKTIMPVEFDVATTVEDDDTKSAGGGVRVLGISAGVDGVNSLKNTSASRVSFRIPLALP